MCKDDRTIYVVTELVKFPSGTRAECLGVALAVDQDKPPSADTVGEVGTRQSLRFRDIETMDSCITVSAKKGLNLFHALSLPYRNDRTNIEPN